MTPIPHRPGLCAGIPDGGFLKLAIKVDTCPTPDFGAQIRREFEIAHEVIRKHGQPVVEDFGQPSVVTGQGTKSAAVKAGRAPNHRTKPSHKQAKPVGNTSVAGAATKIATAGPDAHAQRTRRTAEARQETCR
jgi:hypothetical protein